MLKNNELIKDTLKDKKVLELKEICKNLNINKTGKKDILIDNIFNAEINNLEFNTFGAFNTFHMTPKSKTPLNSSRLQLA